MKNTMEQSSSNLVKCPLCGGSLWELYEATVFDYGEGVNVDMARKCPKCSGSWRLNDRTGVPEEFHEADITKFNFGIYSKDMSAFKKVPLSFVNNYGAWQNKGKGLYLWSSTPGSGKTFLACCMAKSVMIKHDLQMRFITAPDYIKTVGDNFKRDRGDVDTSAIYRECALLILDDIGAQIDKDWQRQELFKLINGRMSSGLVTIFTSNMPVEDLNVDARTIDRIIKMSVVLPMPEESIRRKKAKSEQDNFLKEILG